jgi:hypothetical protein
MTKAIDARLAELGLGREAKYQLPGGQKVPWRLSPQPFVLDDERRGCLSRFGFLMTRFYFAADRIYQSALSDARTGFVADYLDAGKPEAVIQYGRHARFKGQLPLILRPDLLWTDQGFVATEFDSVPGGAGLLAGMENVYRELGHAVPSTGDVFARTLLDFHGKGAVAIVVSDESSAYRPEMTYLAGLISSEDVPVLCLRPEELTISSSGVFFGTLKIGTIYRFFELFDLDNVPNGHSLINAAMQGSVRMTPPPKAYLEEKMWFSLLRHHALEESWQKHMGESAYGELLALIPESHILDSRPIPPHGILPGVTKRGRPVSSFDELRDLPRGERQYVIKPSGFSEFAWGSKGINLGRELSTKAWGEILEVALAGFPLRTHILQKYHYSLLEQVNYYDFALDQVLDFAAKIRYCPFFFLSRKTALSQGGVLITACPAEKPLIHGMTEAVMVPAALG